MDSLNRSKYQVFEVIKYAYKFDRSIPEYDLDERMREYYRVWANKTVRYKTYYFADKTMQRVGAMDFSKLEASDFMSIYSGQREKGAVVTSGNYGLLNFGYVLTPNHVILGVYQKAIRATDTLLLDNGQTDDYGFRARFIGNVIINSDGITYNPNSVITVAMREKDGNTVNMLTKQAEMLARLKAIAKELRRIDNTGSEPLDVIAEKHREDSPVLNYELKAYKERYGLLHVALKMFLFLKTASVIEQTYISEEPACSARRKPGQQRGYIRVDSTWDGDITVLNPFMVRGHFRHQPKKNDKGEWIRPLIYIDAFMKQGYHRRAQKVIENEPKKGL